MKRILTLFLFGLVFLIAGRAEAGGSVLYIEGPMTMPTKTPVTFSVYIDAGEALNAYDLELGYDAGTFRVSHLSAANSLATVWKELPLVTGGTIRFRGGSLSPFLGNHGKLFSFDLEALKSGNTELSWLTGKVYLANGKGSERYPETKNLKINAEESVARPKEPELRTVPPEIKELRVVDDPASSRELLTFLLDNSRGGAEVIEVRYFSLSGWGPWRATSNASVLPSGILAIDLRVRSGSGDTAEQVIYNPRAIQRLVLSFIFVLGLVWIFFRFKKKR